MTRDEMNQYIRSITSPTFTDELTHYMSIEDREYEYDEVCALLDMVNAHELALNEVDAEFKAQYRKHIREDRLALIHIGFYTVMSQADIDDTFISSGTPWVFKMGGVAYTAEETFEDWFNFEDWGQSGNPSA